MNFLNILDRNVKPNMYTIINGVYLASYDDGKYIIKKKTSNIGELFDYLKLRNYYDYPVLVSDSFSPNNVFEYEEEAFVFPEQKIQDVALSLSSLHNKTIYFKNVNISAFERLYNDISNNILYLRNYYKNIFVSCLEKEFMNAFEYKFSRCYYIIKVSLDKAQDYLDAWQEEVSGLDRQRVSVIHNNVKLEHFIENDNKKMFVSWDKSTIDSPVLDLVTFYRNEWDKVSFVSFFDKYFSSFELLSYERKLLWCLLLMPDLITFKECDFLKLKRFYDYLFYTNNLADSYDSKKQDKEQDDFN